MPDQKITQLPAGTVTPASILPAVNGAVTQKVTVQQILDIVGTVEGPAGQKGDKGDKGDPGQDAEVQVFEQQAAPAGLVLKEGYLWVRPGSGTDVVDPATTVAAPTAPQPLTTPLASTGARLLTIEDVDQEIEKALTDPSNAALSELKATILDAVMAKINGGPVKVADYGWTPCVKVAGAGDIEACIRSGRLYLRGTCTITATRWTHVRTLPSNFPKPPAATACVCVGSEAGVAERLVAVFINPDKTIHVSTLGAKITDFRLDSASCLM
jgi:hypothetical protein